MVSRTARFSKRLSDMLNGKKIPSNIYFIAACNPFKIKAKSTDVGLIPESNASIFSHRVFPIPESLMNLSWNFGQLSKE